MAAPATPFTVCVDSAFTVPEMQAELEANFRVVVCADFDPIGVPPELIASVVGLLCRGHAKVNAAVLAKWPNLRAVVAFGVGYDHITVSNKLHSRFSRPCGLPCCILSMFSMLWILYGCCAGTSSQRSLCRWCFPELTFATPWPFGMKIWYFCLL